MTLCEAREQIAVRITEVDENLRQTIPEYIEALEMAVKALDAQMRLFDILNDMSDDDEHDYYSDRLVKYILNECRYDWSDSDGEVRDTV